MESQATHGPPNPLGPPNPCPGRRPIDGKLERLSSVSPKRQPGAVGRGAFRESRPHK